ncbi:CEP76 C2 domain-containing protein [Zopfochytrium polystomum]|nr:CEP76 C2 domain-containing protein [Zopfochytrium polystomum]
MHELQMRIREQLSSEEIQNAIRSMTMGARREDDAKALVQESGLLDELAARLQAAERGDRSRPRTPEASVFRPSSNAQTPSQAYPMSAAALAFNRPDTDSPRRRQQSGSLPLSPTKSLGGMSTGGMGSGKQGKRYLRLTIARGLAFLGDADVSEDGSHVLEIHVHFQDKRFSSAQVASSTEPLFNFQRMVELPSIDLSILTQIPHKLNLLITRTHYMTGSRSIVGSRSLEWREILAGGAVTKIVEVWELGAPDVTVGLLEVSMELVPRNSPCLAPEEVAFQFKKESRQSEEAHRQFYVFAKQWWNDFLQIRPSNADKLVKIFAEDEEGKKQPVTNFVSRISSRYIESPRHAARFVSLLAVDKAQSVGNSRAEVWQSPHTILTMSKTSIPGHALLLTSLLLGLSLNAYTTLGTAVSSSKSSNSASNLVETATAWVTTISSSGEAEFWDPVTGNRCRAADGQAFGFRSVGCLFNDEGFWANIALSDAVEGLSFVLSDINWWKSMPRDAILAMRRTPPINFPILPFHPTHPSRDNSNSATVSSATPAAPVASPNIPALEQEIESVLRYQMATFREEHDLLSSWDEDLSHLLSQCLWSCEMGKLVRGGWGGVGGPTSSGGAGGGGSSSSNLGLEGPAGREFQEGVKRSIPEGHTFKGFPCHFSTLNPGKIFQKMVRAPQCRELLLVRGDSVRYGLRVRVFPVCEGCAGCWVMLAVRFKPI